MTSELTQAALEPCPFCGGKAEWKDDPKICGVPFGLVVDHKPDCFLAMPMSEEAMLAAWNTRLTAQSGEGRSGAGEDVGPFHVSQSGDGKKLWFSARDPASGVTIPARDRTDARNLVSSLNHACATFAALNARQSGEGERESAFPTKPGYYWAKLKTPHGMPEGEDWASRDWEIVKVWENEVGGYDPNNDESLAVFVHGVPVTQWPLDFFWGPKVDARPPA